VAIIECVPNISDGRRVDVVGRIVEAVRRVRGARLLDYSSDAAHNRSVITMAGDAAPLKDAVLAIFETALAEIDLRIHHGEHPRLGAVDVVPFVPIDGVTMDDCIALAKETARSVAERFALPVYLYEEASSNPLRKNLEDIRRGEFEGLAAKMATDGWTPDYGPPTPHPTAGASVIGARMPLIAYNINLATDRLDVAKKIAAAVRFSSGGFRYVKAMGVTLAERGIVQVSINLTNYEKTPVLRVFEAVKHEAERYGVNVLESEIVGLVPSAALVDVAQSVLQLSQFRNDQILEARLRAEPGDVEKWKS
jgi:glutamate formiminotransferase